jgi:4-hydroxy-3-methylbut-2-enyl diphosphate reductase
MKKTEIKIADSAGFCFGVKRLLNWFRAQRLAGDKVCTLDRLYITGRSPKSWSAGSYDHRPPEDNIEKRSHNKVTRRAIEIYDKLKENGVLYTDATCPFLRKIHSIAQNVEKTNFDNYGRYKTSRSHWNCRKLQG